MEVGKDQPQETFPGSIICDDFDDDDDDGHFVIALDDSGQDDEDELDGCGGRSPENTQSLKSDINPEVGSSKPNKLAARLDPSSLSNEPENNEASVKSVCQSNQVDLIGRKSNDLSVSPTGKTGIGTIEIDSGDSSPEVLHLECITEAAEPEITGQTGIETIEIDSCDSSPEILHLECTTEAVEPEISARPSQELKNKALLNPGLLKETNKLPEFIRSCPDIIRQLKSSLIEPEITAGPSQELKDKAPLNPGLLKETNKLPEFIRSCPDIIRQLKSSLIDHSVVSVKESNKLSSQSTPNCGQANIFSSKDEGKCTGQAKKFDFTPRDDCTCIMCNGWTASKFVSQIPENCSSPNHKGATFDQEFLVNNGKCSSTSNSIHSERCAEDIGLGTSSHTSNNHQGQKDHESDAPLKNTSPEPSLLILKDRLKKNVLLGQKQLQSLHSKQSLSNVSVTSSVGRVNEGKKSILMPDGTKPLNSNRYVLIDNGTYYKALPQTTLSTSSSSLPMLTKAPGVPPGTKLPSKVNRKESKGQNLVLTREFVSSYQPTLKYILNKASKVDLSNPEQVCIVFSEASPKLHIPTELSSNTRILIQPTGSAQSAVCSLSKDVGYPLPTSGIGDVLLGIINSHLKVNSTQNKIATSLGENSACLKKIPSVCQASGSHFNSSTVSSSSNHNHLILSSQKNSPILQSMKVSQKIIQSQTLPLSSLPPPPPLLRCPTAPISVSVKATSLVGKQKNDCSVVDEPRETLVIPIPKDPPSKHAKQKNSSNNVGIDENWSSDLYTFSAPLDISPVKTQHEILNEVKKEYIHVSNELIPTQKEPQESTIRKLLSSQFVPVSSTSLNVPTLEELSQDRRIDTTAPPVIRVNLSSCASFTCPKNTISPHLKFLNPMPPDAFKPLVKSQVLSSDAVVVNSCLQEEAVISAQVTASNHLAALLTKSSSSSASLNCANTVNKHLPNKQSFQGKLSAPYCSLPVDNVPDTTAKANRLGRVSLATTTSSLSKVTTTKSASAFIPITCPLQTSKIYLPSTTNSLTVSSLSTSLSSSSSSSSSSVSVSGLKLKIRLGDVKTNGQEEETVSENCGQSSNTPGMNVEVSGDSFKQINQDHSTGSKRSETAEEMFLRFQEQAMQQVYNAQFGVGDLSRSLRPSRCNISFVDQGTIPRCLIDEGKKKKLPEEKVDSAPSVQQPASLSKKKKPSEESVKGLAFTGIVLNKPAGSENVAKGKKRRQPSNESNCDIPRKEPKFDIDSYPKFRQDNSILMKKTIYTPNIMAGHKVFVKFNVFSNPQSGCSFLAPFFNLGGSRVQFDVEDMEYIKKSVVEIEKEDKTCARHLLYYSREGKKATFLRKENLAHMSELNDKYYKKCSYILEGFSREPTKKIVPIPDEWKLDKKVSIEIDTADTDNNITIDFGSCHVLPEENLIMDPDTYDSKGQGDIKSNDCIAENDSKVAKSVTKIGAGSGSICLNSNRTKGEHGVDTCDNTRKNVSGHCEKQNHTKPIVHTSTPVMASDSVRTVVQSSCNVKSSNFRPNILRKKISSPPLKPNLKNPSCQFSPEVSLLQSSLVSEASYTDQLKELFVSGSLQRTLPPVSMTPCLKEFLHTNNEKVKLKPESSKSSCSNSLDGFIKKEIIDHEYDRQSKSPLLEKSKESSLEESRKSEEESLSKSNVEIKPEPIDDYFDSLERNSQANVVTPQVEKSAENNLDNIPTDQPISSGKPDEIIPSSTDQSLVGQNNTEESSNTVQFENDEDTLSACSDSPVHSSSVSESSEITPSSCIDTSDELEDESDTDLDSELLSSSTMSFTSDVPESSPLNSGNVAPNPTKTKITSLVESLKQRLKENSAVPSVFPEPVKQPKVKLRKKKSKRKRSIMTEQPIPNNFNGSNDISIESKTDKTSVGMDPVRSASADTTTSPSITCNTTSIAQDKSFTSPMSDLFSPIVDSPSTTLSPSVSSSICSLSENTSNNSVNPITSAVPRVQAQSPSGSVESDVSEFKKLFPFTTSVPLVNQDSNSKEKNLLSKDEVKVKKPAHESKPCKDQCEEEELVLIDDVKENHTPKEIGGSLGKSSFISDPLSNSKVTDTESMRSTPCSDIDVGTEADIDVGTESDIDVGTECFPEISISMSTHPKLPFSSPPLPTNGRNLRDFTRESEFIMSKEDYFQSKKDPKQQQERPQNGNKDTSNVSPSKFTLPLRNRTKSNKRKAVPPKVVSKQSVASILCQKLDITVDPIVPKLTGKVITPLELEGYVDSGKDQSQSFTHTEIDQSVSIASKISSPKPINPTFKPSINAIFGVESIPTSVDSLINKQNLVKPTITEASLNKQNRSQPKKQTAKKATVSNLKKRNSQKQPETHVEIEDKKETKDETKSSNTDLKDDKNGVLSKIHRYRSLRKFAWRKGPRLPDSDGNTDESFTVLENTESDTDVYSVKNDDVIKEVAIKQCDLLLHRLEHMNWGSGGPVMISPGTYLVKDVEEQDKHDNSEISQKRKKKSVLKKSKKSKAIRPKKDIVDYYTAAIENLRRKALLLEENEKKEAEKKGMESKVILKVEVDESSELNFKDNESNGEINMHQDEECELEISQLQTEATKTSLLSDNDEKDKVAEDAPGGSDENEMTCSSSRNDVRIQTLPKTQPQTPKTLADKTISKHTIIYDNDTANISNSQEPENKSVDSGNVLYMNNQGDNTSIRTIDFDLKSAGSSDDIVQNSALTVCRMSKGNRKGVHIAERNFEGDYIKVFNTFFQDQDDVEEDIDDWMEYSEEEDTSASGKEDKGTTVNESPERKDDDGRGPINIIERNYEGEFIKSLWTKSHVQNNIEDISDTVMGVCDEQNECSLSESERDTASDESEINISQKGSEEETSLYKVIENANKTIVEVRDSISNVSTSMKDQESEESRVTQDIENMSSKPYTSDQTPQNDKLQSTEPVQVGSVALTKASSFTNESGSIFTNKDIVLGFEDELGADTVLSKLGSADADDMFLLDDGDETENIALIPDDEVERLLGLHLKSGENDRSLEEENKISDGANELNKPKLSWKLLFESDSKKGKDENERCEEQKSLDSNKPFDNSQENRNEGCGSDTDHVEMTDKLKSPNSSLDIDANVRSMSPERITGNGDTKTANISPSWKRILGSQALKEIQESVTSAIASVSSKQESANSQKLGEQKNLNLKNDKLKLKLCTGALSKALKLSVEMRKTLKDNPTESNSGKEIRKTKNEVGQDRRERSSFSATVSRLVDKGNKSALIDENMESSRKDVPSEVRKKKPQSGYIKQTSSLMEMNDDNVFYKVDNDKSNDINEYSGKTSIMSGFDNIPITEGCIPTESKNSCKFSEAESEIDGKKTPDNFVKTASTKNIIKAFGNKTIDLTKLKMKLNPLLASGKSKSVSKDVAGKQVNDKDSTSTLLVGSSSALLAEQNLSSEKTTVGAHSKEQPPVTETSLHTASTKQAIVAPQINKEKLSNILKNFKKPLSLKLNPGISSKDLLLSNSPEKGKDSAGRISSLRKRKQSPKQTEDTHTESKRSKMFTLNKNLEKHSGVNFKFIEENSEIDDKGERSCFDCLSGITPDLWNSK